MATRDPCRNLGVVALAFALLAAYPAPALAYHCDIGTAPNPSRSTSPYDGLSWDWRDHRDWYVRFWTGKCAETLDDCWEELPFFGAPYWDRIMSRGTV